jgi:prophage tail gpP-like protein
VSTRSIRQRSPLDPHTEDPDDVVVESGGRAISGWKSVEITRRLDAASGTFRLEIQHVEPWPIRAGAEVRISAGGTVVVTGYVDTIEAEIGHDSTSLVVSGRDRTEDLVDCAAPESPTELRGVNLEELATHCAKPLGIEVVTRLAEDLPFDFRLNAGESCWSAIERACRKRGVLAFPDQLGRLVLAFPATSRTDRDIGPTDFKSGRLRWQQSERFRVYKVTGQRPGTDDAWGAAAAEVLGEAQDLAVDRPRTFVKVAEGPVDQASAEQYARWMATVRAARAAQVTLELMGWRQKPRERLWEVNQLVGVNIPRWRLNGQLLLVNAVKFSYPPRVVTLELSRRDAYRSEPVVDTEKDPMRGWGDDSEAPEDLE